MSVEIIRISKNENLSEKLSSAPESARVVVVVIEGRPIVTSLKPQNKPLIGVLKCSVSLELINFFHLCFADESVKIEGIEAQDLVKSGLINDAFDAERLESYAIGVAEKIASLAPLAISGFLEAVNVGMKMPLEESLVFEAQLFSKILATKDAAEGISAFLQKRRPHFRAS